MDFIRAADIRYRPAVQIRPADRIIQQSRGAWNNSKLIRFRKMQGVIIIIEGGELEAHNHFIFDFRHQNAEDIPVVTQDHIRVAGMALRGLITQVVAGPVRPRPAEDHVTAVRTPGRSVQTEQIGIAADNIILTQTTEDNIVTAITFDIVIAVTFRFKRGSNVEEPVIVTISVDSNSIINQGIDRTVALNDIVTQLSENGIILRATGDVVVAEVVGAGCFIGIAVIEDIDFPVFPDRGTIRVFIILAIVD